MNRAYCLALGDTSQPAWDEAPDWQQSSARSGVTGHPCFVPYSDLPAAQQVKDHLFTSTVREVARALRAQ